LHPEHTSSHSRRRRAPRSRSIPVSGGRAPVATRAAVPAPHQEARSAPDVELVPFDTLGLHPAVLAGVAERRFARTTAIQSWVVPLAIAGRDIIACAPTGTGKTAAFVLPLLDRLVREREQAGPEGAAAGRTRVLILTPTRELAVQIDDDIQGFGYHTGLSSMVVCGGLPGDPQDRALRAGVDFVVATPGRLMDHMRSDAADFSSLDVLVLDEADRMMDMGFWPDVRRIVAALPAARQTLLFSATIPDEVRRLASEIVRDPAMIGLAEASRQPDSITHAIETMPSGEKAEWLARFLRRQAGPVLVFVRTRRGAERLAVRLASSGVRVASLHADRTQQQRLAAVEGLRSGRFTAIVATDVAARGLDIHGITHVVNYEVPSTREAYVHRTGRTGRADATGTALTLVAPEELKALQALARVVGVPLASGGTVQ
jgi:ATP-dependent RNA helicase RhlE